MWIHLFKEPFIALYVQIKNKEEEVHRSLSILSWVARKKICYHRGAKNASGYFNVSLVMTVALA